ncbi:hypothetical protein PIB30_050772 [Stylosanthes scabra]|uniref:Reverse transcriptase domain-containing protein n=1 Tax=Stylosanthes scabra TaxID=79078 RepID=A0ABU6WKG2_9FABA|nr:hypothetical protein [Stylosanthes scabra]
MGEDSNPSIILGRPFLATSRALIDVQKDMLIQEVQEEDSMLALSVDLDDSIEEVEEASEGPVSRDIEQEKPKQELKPLPPTLKYAFLGEEDSFPVIIDA